MSELELSRNSKFAANEKFFCRCCGYNTLSQFPNGTYEICEICFWEDDKYQTENANEKNGSNRVSLIVAQKNFEKFGACDESMISSVREVNENDFRKPMI